MKKKGYDASLAIRLWINEQVTICRIMEEFPKRMIIYYEDLCDVMDDTLAAIHRSVGVAPRRPPVDFKSGEHHILGNEMRLGAVNAIVKDSRWTRELPVADLGTIARACAAFRQRHANHPLSEIIARYGCDSSRAPAPGQALSQTSTEATRGSTVV